MYEIAAHVFSKVRETGVPAPYNSPVEADLPPPVAVDAPACEVRGDLVTRWEYYPRTFRQLLNGLEQTAGYALEHPDVQKGTNPFAIYREAWTYNLIACCMVGYTANGTIVQLGVEDVAQMPWHTGKALLQTVTAPVVPQAAVLGQWTVQLGEPVCGVEVMHFDTAAPQNRVNLLGSVSCFAQFFAVMEASPDGWMLHHLSIADGWFLLSQVHPAMCREICNVRLN